MMLKDRVIEDMKAAMRARDAARLSPIRMLLAAIKQKEIDDRVDLDDAQVMAVVNRQIKQRRDSIAQFEQAGREDLAATERAELEVLSAYLPKQADPAEVQAEVAAAITASAASGLQDMGKVMAILKGKLAGRADLSAISTLVRARLSQ
ncbi:MAG: GatB/YqeY domain-containing protein [Burkholderiaceae bacterium]|nr:GatB/YqeY domain-containing protein [Burkholderiaceae bacterium]